MPALSSVCKCHQSEGLLIPTVSHRATKIPRPLLFLSLWVKFHNLSKTWLRNHFKCYVPVYIKLPFVKDISFQQLLKKFFFLKAGKALAFFSKVPCPSIYNQLNRKWNWMKTMQILKKEKTTEYKLNFTTKNENSEMQLDMMTHT